MAYKHIAYWLSNAYIAPPAGSNSSRPIIKRLKSTAISNTTFPAVGSVPWTDIGPNLQTAFPLTSAFTLTDIATSPSNNEHVIVIGSGLTGGFPGIAFSKDAGDTWVNPLMPTLANYTSAAQAASSGIFSSPFDMTTCGFNPTTGNTPQAVQWLDNNNIFITAGPYILKCSNWINYVNGVDPTPIVQVLAAIHDNRTPDTQFGPPAVACVNVQPGALNVTAIHFETTTKGICSTSIGIFLTINGGTTWSKISKDSQFQTPSLGGAQTVSPWVFGLWNVGNLIGVHLNGPDIVAISQSYILRGVYNTSTSTYDFQPILCSNASTPLSSPLPPGQCCPCSTPSPTSTWRSLNWYMTGVNTYTYYVTGSNNKIYRSTNGGQSWSPWINPDTAYLPASFTPDYQDISFYSSLNCFYVFGNTDGPTTAINELYVFNQSQGQSDLETLNTGFNAQTVQIIKYGAVWVGTNPDVTPPPPQVTSYTLQNCDPNATPQTLCSQNAILAPYVGQVITNIDWALVGSTPPSPYEPEPDCWTVTQNNSSPCPQGGNYNITLSLNPSAPFQSFTGVDACDECLPDPPPPPDPTACFKFVACDDPSDAFYVLITGADEIEEFTGYLGYVISIPELCGNKCFFITECPSGNEDIPITYVDFIPEVMAYDIYPNCAECKGLPPPPDLHPRRIKPGFYTPGCPPEYTVKTYCSFAEQAYDEMVAKRYGVEICCDHDIDKWDIRKQILELKALYDECLCVSNICPKCVEPCNVSAAVIVYNEVQDVPDPPPPCIQPDDGPIIVTLDRNVRCYQYIIRDYSTALFYTYITQVAIDAVIYNTAPIVTEAVQSAAFPMMFIEFLESLGYECEAVEFGPSSNPELLDKVLTLYNTDVPLPLLYLYSDGGFGPIIETIEGYEIECTTPREPATCYEVYYGFGAFVAYTLNTITIIKNGVETLYNVQSLGIVIGGGGPISTSLPLKTYLQSQGYTVDNVIIENVGPFRYVMYLVNFGGGTPVAIYPVFPELPFPASPGYYFMPSTNELFCGG